MNVGGERKVSTTTLSFGVCHVTILFPNKGKAERAAYWVGRWNLCFGDKMGMIAIVQTGKLYTTNRMQKTETHKSYK